MDVPWRTSWPVHPDPFGTVPWMATSSDPTNRFAGPPVGMCLPMIEAVEPNKKKTAAPTDLKYKIEFKMKDLSHLVT